MPETTRLILLGATGSIGRQTLDVIEALNRLADRGEFDRRFEVVGLAANTSAETVFEQASRTGARHVALSNGGECPASAAARRAGVEILRGPDAAERLVRTVDADIVLAAMVGAAGLPATLAALELGRDVALANKETLVAAGALVVPAAQRSGARLLPVDSEHSALWQCLPAHCVPPCALGADVKRLILTASGGPFRTRSKQQVYDATPEEALAHPTWNMGPKVTIDCASLTNKALEIIEAHWLFGVEGERIDVLVHPQSIIHSFVEFADGSTIAQLGAPDMRTPIQFALVFPDRPAGCAPAIDWTRLPRLDFEQPDVDRFPALRLAYEVIDRGGASGAVFNAANEVAVQAFIDHEIPFGRIPELAEEALRSLIGDRAQRPLASLAEAMEADAEARRFVASRLNSAPTRAAAAR